jgi:hypothetical protein
VEEVPEDTFGFLEALPLPAVMLDAGGVIIGFNSPFSDLLGGVPEALSPSGGFSFMSPVDRARLTSLLRGMAGGGHANLVTSLLRKNGERVTVESFWSPHKIAGRPSDRYLGLFLEVPPKNHPPIPMMGYRPDTHPAGLRRTGWASPGFEPGQGRIDWDRRNQIIHTIIFHDAKNRLAALHGYADLLRQSLSDSGILSHIGKLEELASDIEHDLGVASIFSHLGLIEPRWQNIREAIGRSVSREPRGRICIDELPESLWCLADPLFPRVFSNLFENARRHGEKVTSIRILAREAENSLVISVEDDGIGIPIDQKEQIFELGFGRHTGYGLYLAREVLSVAGFSIRETGDPGKGARFEIHIPKGLYLRHPPCPEEQDPIHIPAA